ncbi:interferon-induced protein 44-like isoform 1-T3 [Salvelinus alpinus]|uniref:interferon-induced protein 44 n=1 Tax=Salvelinus sp. IW2-2015 TaxID=2691554 RepID=UPI000CEB2754|nr:interferon-induced protein 44-like [Salvelinus alpinus]XP_023998580.1 interferon-induced protein 44-like [Salvelinus alpinus]XP_023998581.1 interferon-induced protein 44-like [Salvelinus alpinus]
MGLFKSKPSPPAPPPSPAFSNEWRRTPWDQKEEMLQKLKDYVPENPQVKTIRILLHGPAGAGKSSFINSINNIFQDKCMNIALADNTFAGASFTKKYETHKIVKEKPGTYYPFLFYDVMGLENGIDKGVDEADIIKALKGHVKEGYTFNPVSPLKEENEYYVKAPTLSDRVHCLVSAIPANKLPMMNANKNDENNDVFKKMRAIRLAASYMGIPQMVILTKVDLACPLVRKDLKKVYWSKYIKEKMEQCSNELGVPVNCILPVKNYHEEIDLDDDMDVLLLRSLKQMVDFAESFKLSQAD